MGTLILIPGISGENRCSIAQKLLELMCEEGIDSARFNLDDYEVELWEHECFRDLCEKEEIAKRCVSPYLADISSALSAFSAVVADGNFSELWFARIAEMLCDEHPTVTLRVAVDSRESMQEIYDIMSKTVNSAMIRYCQAYTETTSLIERLDDWFRRSVDNVYYDGFLGLDFDLRDDPDCETVQCACETIINLIKLHTRRRTAIRSPT